ncbi:hypothetical protein [Streptomyces sp. NPDC001380]|uniref:hypothetical protein n=1 Tax=Streptomyces sp. NPDC001380 TaxID=3364566 RepID=UPI0036C8D860
MTGFAGFTAWVAGRLGLPGQEAAETEGGVPRRELFLRDGLGADASAAVHREALRVLRDDLDALWLDALSDGPWPAEVLPFVERALRLGGGRETAIDLDVHDDVQVEVAAALAPYSIAVEGWGAGRQALYEAHDTGTGLCVSLTAAQEAGLAARLAELGAAGALIPRG